MKIILLIISSFIFCIFNTYAAFLNITIDYNKSFYCMLDKQILKNEIYNYKEFSADQLKNNKNKKIKIHAIKSKTIKISGLSDFFSNTPYGAIYDTQILKDDTILVRIVSKDETYSESVFINKSSGEMIHEITTNINSKKQGKELTFFRCDLN